MEPIPYQGALAFLSFVLSVGAAILAVNLYALLRTGKVGASWRVLIIASVIFALHQAVRLGEVLRVPPFAQIYLSSLIELVFVLTLAYAFWLQRQVFEGEAHRDAPQDAPDEDEESEERVVSTYEP